MKRVLLIAMASAGIAGFAAVAGATTLTVTPTDISDLARNTFSVGETVILKIAGDAQGGAATTIFGQLNYEAALTTFLANSQSQQYAIVGPMIHGDGFSYTFNQISGVAPPTRPITDIQNARSR